LNTLADFLKYLAIASVVVTCPCCLLCYRRVYQRVAETWQGNLVVQGIKNLADAISNKVRHNRQQQAWLDGWKEDWFCTHTGRRPFKTASACLFQPMYLPSYTTSSSHHTTMVCGSQHPHVVPHCAGHTSERDGAQSA